VTPLELLVREFLSSCRTRGLSIKTTDQTYKPRLERQFLPWAKANAINEVHQIDQRTIERYQAHLFHSGLSSEAVDLHRELLHTNSERLPELGTQ
jgi:hypothetical protein